MKSNSIFIHWVCSNESPRHMMKRYRVCVCVRVCVWKLTDKSLTGGGVGSGVLYFCSEGIKWIDLFTTRKE